METNERKDSAPLPPFHVLIAAAGGGARFGAGIPKQYEKISGKAVLRHAIENFTKFPEMQSLHVIIDPDHADLYHEAVMGLSLPSFIKGSDERKLSVLSGLNHLSHLKNEDIILIHDAARPFVTEREIRSLLTAMQTSRAASLAAPVSDTLRRSGAEDCLAETVDRTGLYALQTPQGFRYGDLKTAHETYGQQKSYTDDTGLVSDCGIPVKIVMGSKTNIKITYPEDLEIAARLLGSAYETRTGTGFDVHAFAKDPSRKLMLCGVHIPHSDGLAGHSDADVGLHAIADALLGAIAAGDIGLHFPPSDASFKNIDSAVILKHCGDLVQSKGGIVQNIDATLICEYPKIGPHRAAMEARVADILELEPGRVSIKATTTERLGFTGRGEGIAAQAIATIRLRA